MDFFKKHYEKILLGVVLLGMVGGLVVLPLYIMHDRELLDQYSSYIIKRTPQPLTPLDLGVESNSMERIEVPYRLDLETTNRLFNPLEWKRRADGTLAKSASLGAHAAVITKIAPLYFILTLDGVETNFGDRYIIGVERQSATVPWQRAKRQHYASLGERNDTFTITAVKGPPASPTQLVLQLTDSGETATVSKDKPFRRVDGYMADLRYDPEDKNWQEQRVGDDLKFAGEDYIIVAINQNEVVLSAQSNQKKTTLTYKSR